MVRDTGNFAIQPTNRIHLYDPSLSTKPNENLIQRKVNTRKWDVEDAAKWITSDDDLYNYGVVSNPLNFTAQDLEPFFLTKKEKPDAEAK